MKISAFPERAAVFILFVTVAFAAWIPTSRVADIYSGLEFNGEIVKDTVNQPGVFLRFIARAELASVDKRAKPDFNAAALIHTGVIDRLRNIGRVVNSAL